MAEKLRLPLPVTPSHQHRVGTLENRGQILRRVQHSITLSKPWENVLNTIKKLLRIFSILKKSAPYWRLDFCTKILFVLIFGPVTNQWYYHSARFHRAQKPPVFLSFKWKYKIEWELRVIFSRNQKSTLMQQKSARLIGCSKFREISLGIFRL